MTTIKQAIIDAVDQHMPGRRIGSTPPKDWRDEAKAALARVGMPPEDGTTHDLGLTAVRSFCLANDLPEDDGFVREFRRQAILSRMRDAVSDHHQPKGE
jgi:hypothetical protein